MAKFISSVMKLFLIAGGLTFFFLLLFLYLVYMVQVTGGSVPDETRPVILHLTSMCFIFYVISGFIWNKGREKTPSIHKEFISFFLGSLFFIGAFFFFIAIYVIGNPLSIDEPARTSEIQANEWVVILTSLIMAVTAAKWIRGRKKSGPALLVCPHCGHYLPEDVQICPICGKHIS
ncbi:MAG: zinc-ribbon domain-containing protein [Theionarchaea archaeon]|nr:zinc-ribbon domain-containing protein [Theionarchaea archaeon]